GPQRRGRRRWSRIGGPTSHHPVEYVADRRGIGMVGTQPLAWVTVCPPRPGAETPVSMVNTSALDRTFEAVIFDWDGTAVPDRDADARHVGELVEALCAAGVHVIVISGTHVGNVDGQLQARPAGPGTLHLALNRGSEVFAAGPGGGPLVWRPPPSPARAPGP